MAETCAGIKFCLSKKNTKYLTKTFAFGDFWKKFCGKNFREFKIREMLAASKKKKSVIVVGDDYSRNKSLLLKIASFL